MNKVGSDSVRWHLEQAALLQLCANRASRHGFDRDAERWLVKAEKHREAAAALDQDTQTPEQIRANIDWGPAA